MESGPGMIVNRPTYVLGELVKVTEVDPRRDLVMIGIKRRIL